MRTLPVLLVICICLPVILKGQDTGYGPGYQMMMMHNPGLAGSEPDSKLRLSYLNFYPGKSYDLHSVYVSYDSYFPGIHGGAGFYLSDDYLGGIINHLRGGLSYAYSMKAGADLFINAGLTASFYHRGFNFSKALLPDQIDPLGGFLPTGEVLTGSSHTVFDIGAGFIFIAGKISGGLSVSHLAEPDLSVSVSSDEKLYRKVLMHFSGDFELNSTTGIKIRPLAFMEVQNDFISGGPGVVFENPFLSLNMMLLANNEKAVDIQTGFSLTTGKLVTFYNYRFNLLSGNNMLPFSLVLQTGLSYSLNIVEKRKNTRAMDFPKM